jgi:hypothetical protein
MVDRALWLASECRTTATHWGAPEERSAGCPNGAAFIGVSWPGMPAHKRGIAGEVLQSRIDKTPVSAPQPPDVQLSVL